MSRNIVVKSLVWECLRSGDGTEYWRADSILGGYAVCRRNRMYEMDGDFYATLELAQAAAQADYADRVLSAIVEVAQ